MKRLIYPTIIVILSSSALADAGDMMGSGMMMGNFGMMGGGLYSIVCFALAVFIFSIIFWLTHNWLVKNKKR